jgi:hypothetical protein
VTDGATDSIPSEATVFMVRVIWISNVKPIETFFALCFPRFETRIKFVLSFAKSAMAPQARIYYLVTVHVRLITG